MSRPGRSEETGWQPPWIDSVAEAQVSGPTADPVAAPPPSDRRPATRQTKDHRTDEGEHRSRDERHHQHRRVRALSTSPAVGRQGPGVRLRAGARAPIGGLPRRGHHHHGGGGGPPGPPVGPRSGAGQHLVRHRHAGVPRQDQRHHPPRRPAPALPGGGLRLRRRPAFRRGRPPAASLAAAGTGTTLVVLADLRDGLPTSADESSGGDGAAAVLVADDAPGTPVIAEYLGGASVSDEFLDRWRTPGDRRSKVWEERFGETRYVPLGTEAWEAGAQERSGLDAADQVDQVWRSPACTQPGGQGPGRRKLGVRDGEQRWSTTSAASVGQTGTAHPGLVLASMVERSGPGPGGGGGVPGRRGRGVLILPNHRGASRDGTPAEPVADQIAGRPPTSVTAKFLRPGGDGDPRAAPPPRAAGGSSPPLRPGAARTGSSVSSGSKGPPRPGAVPPPPGPGVDERGCRRRHGPHRPGRHPGHHRHLHHRPAGLLPQPSHRLRHPRLRRRRSVPGRADRCRPRPRWTSATG